MLIHIVKNTIKPGTAEAYTEVAKEFMAYVKENCHGCISARVMMDPKDETMVANILEWEDRKALKDHLAGDSLMKFVDRLSPYFVGNTTEVYETE